MKRWLRAVLTEGCEVEHISQENDFVWLQSLGGLYGDIPCTPVVQRYMFLGASVDFISILAVGNNEGSFQAMF